MVEREANSSRPRSADLDQEKLRAQQDASQINWQWRLATCDPAERASLEVQARQDQLAWEEKTGCKVHISIDRKALAKYLVEHDSPNVGSPEIRAWARNYLKDR